MYQLFAFTVRYLKEVLQNCYNCNRFHLNTRPSCLDFSSHLLLPSGTPHHCRPLIHISIVHTYTGNLSGQQILDPTRSRKMSAIWAYQLRHVWFFDRLRHYNHPCAHPDASRLKSPTSAESGYYCAFLAWAFYYSLFNFTNDPDSSDCIWERELNVPCALGNCRVQRWRKEGPLYSNLHLNRS